ncbi:alpha/beta fold hydrolase [Aldersonia sp. NBC_00410]|uniref:esterase/lipase family protein n=1 Tax=Aldersonia sp. NBC_00410 TaxID=2975954 RepID=UPI00224E75DC|nr:alpha/beta fold hydrolase [Aldersonia sp. NBC_00410]MCX5045921.1 alpha/beta fold hydrolase [Aldersonia sp. NBC_00410]
MPALTSKLRRDIRYRRSRGTLAGAALAVTAAFLAAAPATAAPPPAPPNTVGVGPATNNFPGAFAQSLLTPDAAPVGANDWNCKPSADHPRPVVLVHGTWENAYNNFSGVAPVLARAGYCVFALNYGRVGLLESGGLGTVLPNTNGVGPIEESAKQLAGFVDAVLRETGAGQVDIVGHSQGGLMARQYLKFEGGANAGDPSKNKVAHLVTLGATNHGTTLDGIGSLDRAIRSLGLDLDPALNYLVGYAPMQQVFDSAVLNRLNAGGDTMPGVDYTVIGTMFDEVTTPFDWTFLKSGPGATVRNVTLQDGCPTDISDHLSIAYSPRAIDWIQHGLDPQGFPESKVRCVGNAPIGGSSDGGPGGTGSAG